MHREHTENIEELFQFCCNDQNHSKCYVSSDSTGKNVVMFMLSSTAAFTEQFPDLPADSRVTVLGFQFTGDLALSVYARSTPLHTHCIVGLPANVARTVENGEQHMILLYHPSPDKNATTKVLCGDFWRLLSFGRWIPINIINWYANLLSATKKESGFRIEDSKVCTSLLEAVKAAGDEGDCDWARAEALVASETLHHRVVYLCFLDSHWTLTVFDVANVNRHGRLVVIDSLDIYDQRIMAGFTQFLKHRGFKRVSFSPLNGGQQSANSTECGIFCLQNLDVMFETPLFFQRSRLADRCQRAPVGWHAKCTR